MLVWTFSSLEAGTAWAKDYKNTNLSPNSVLWTFGRKIVHFSIFRPNVLATEKGEEENGNGKWKDRERCSLAGNTNWMR